MQSAREEELLKTIEEQEATIKELLQTLQAMYPHLVRWGAVRLCKTIRDITSDSTGGGTT